MENRKRGEDTEIDGIVKEQLTCPLLTGFVNIGKESTCMPDLFADVVGSVKTFEVENSDVMVISYPRSGTTWTQEMVWLIANNLDYEGTKVPLTKRFPYFEMCSIFNYENRKKVAGDMPLEAYFNSIEYTRALKHPRFIKTHLPFSLLPDDIQNGRKSPKIIYVVRNPKDVFVSYYHIIRAVFCFKVELDSFYKVHLAGKCSTQVRACRLCAEAYVAVGYGSYWKHVLGYWEHRSKPNLLFVAYEDMAADLPSVVRKVAKFLGKPVPDAHMKRLCQHLSFGCMKDNSAVNNESTIECWNPDVSRDALFIRSGRVGKHKEEMSPEMIKEFDAWVRRNVEGSAYAEAYGYIL